MERNAFFENLQSRIGRMLDETPASDLRNNLRALMQQGFEHFDLATREQLDLQTELLSRAQTRIADLERRIEGLERERGTGSAPVASMQASAIPAAAAPSPSQISPLQDSPLG